MSSIRLLTTSSPSHLDGREITIHWLKAGNHKMQDMSDQTPMPINKDQISGVVPKFGSTKYNPFFIDQNWSAMIFIDPLWDQSLKLIFIDQHRGLIRHVLKMGKSGQYNANIKKGDRDRLFHPNKGHVISCGQYLPLNICNRFNECRSLGGYHYMAGRGPKECGASFLYFCPYPNIIGTSVCPHPCSILLG